MNEESIRNRIRLLLDEIQNKADPVELNRCRSIFRQEVSFFSRSYMAAYLLLLAEDSGPPVEKPVIRGKQRKSARAPSQPDETRGEASKALGEEESVQLFISIGRNRKVYPREILALILAKTKIARDDIGVIRILDNYSFVQVRNTVSETVIGALNGQHFRGRTLTVNYARSREENNSE